MREISGFESLRELINVENYWFRRTKQAMRVYRANPTQLNRMIAKRCIRLCRTYRQAINEKRLK